MKFEGKLFDVNRNLMSGNYLITFSTDELPNSITDMTDDVMTIEVKKKSRKRSLDANKYAWLIMSKIADQMKLDKESVYENMLTKYGQPFVADGQVQMISVLSNVDVHKFGLYVKAVGTGHADGKEFTHYMVLRGSSTYDTKEMSIFIDGIVSDAKELGIDTIPRVELEKLKEKWHL